MNTIPVDKIVLSDKNVRKSAFQIDELVSSIKQDGIIEPIILRPNGDKYEVVAGQRRFLGAKEAGYKEFKVGGEKPDVIIRGMTNEEALRISLIEGVHQQGLDPMDEANALKDLVQLEGVDLTQKHKKRGVDIAMRKVAEKTGLSIHHIDAYLRLLRASPKIQKAVSEKKIPIHIATSYVHGFPLDVQDKLADVITGMSQFEARDVIQHLKQNPKKTPEEAKEFVLKNKRFYPKVGLIGKVYFPLFKYCEKNKKSFTEVVSPIVEDWVKKNV